MCVATPGGFGYAGLVDAVAEVLQTGDWPLTAAAVDVLLQLLLHCQRVQPLDDADFMAPVNGPKLLADTGRRALERGAFWSHNGSHVPCHSIKRILRARQCMGFHGLCQPNLLALVCSTHGSTAALH